MPPTKVTISNLSDQLANSSEGSKCINTRPYLDNHWQCVLEQGGFSWGAAPGDGKSIANDHGRAGWLPGETASA